MAGAGERARAFFAIWPDPAVRDALASAGLRAHTECGGRATPAAKIHLTLFFVGEVERARIPELESCAAALAAPAFELRTDVLGYWRHNRIVWAGTREAPRELGSLVAALSANLAGAGWRGEDRPYVPHVTLVRNVKRAPSETVIDSPNWTVREIALVQSAGGRYETLAKWPLRPPL
jgi:RNA 2',3'-cyclic 3'-phosphodiesterase